jgi:hypothetical protein
MIKVVPLGERGVLKEEINSFNVHRLSRRDLTMKRGKKIALFMVAFSILIVVSEGYIIAYTAGQTYPQTTLQTTPAISREQAIQLALQEAETLNLTPFFGGGPIVHEVDPNPSNVTFYYSYGSYPKWLITFNATFYWPMGHSPGNIQVQVAADTGKIDNTNATALPSQNPTPTITPTPTPNLTPTSTPTKVTTPAPTATPESAENSDFVTILISVAVTVIIIAIIALAVLFRRKKHP